MAPIVGKLLNTVGYTTGRGTDGWDTDLEPSLRKLDALVQGNAIAFVNTLPAPVEGATYIIGTSPTGIAAGWANRVVRANAFAGTWDSWVPAVGWHIAVGAQDYRWSGTAWVAGWTPAHAATHEFGGTDPIAGQNLTGLRISDGPRWGAVGIVAPGQNSDLDFRSAASIRQMTIRWNTGSDLLEFFSSNNDGSSRANRLLIPRTTATPITMLGGMNLSSGGLQVGGVEIVSSGRQAEFDKLTVKKALGGTISTASRVEMLNNDASWGGATWMDSGANMRMAFFQNDATWTDRYVFGRNGNLNILSGSLQINAVDAITSAREGRFTGMRLSNMSSGQIPVSSDGNGQITASGLTDDGTFFGVSRVLRMWNSMARSGNTWTDLQWTQDVNERVSILSSNSSGQYAYHSWVFVPPDAEATGRVLGGQMWAQKVSGKSGTAPGLKAAMYAKTAGTGGSTGGFGAQIVFNYRPDNGATQVDALKIGAFGGGVADAVQADILLRAAAGIQTDYIRFGSETQSGNWSPTTTTKRYVKQTGAGTITLPVNCSAYAGMEFTVVMTMTSVANVYVEKDTHGTTDRYFFKDAIPSAWTDVYGFANRLIAGRSPTGGAAAGETALVHFMCDGSYWWIHCD